MKILVVDDVPGWLRFHRNNLEYLNMENLQIDTALNAAEALSKAETEIDEPYDVIFTDMQMESNYLPKLAGEWLIEQIQMFREYKNTKIVIISASPSIELIAKKYGVKYLSKFKARNSDAEVYRQFL
ncbi:response regulator [bacterium]|nr:response regulator [bacterium]MBP3846577.1 response regulator [bacterium]